MRCCSPLRLPHSLGCDPLRDQLRDHWDRAALEPLSQHSPPFLEPEIPTLIRLHGAPDSLNVSFRDVPIERVRTLARQPSRWWVSCQSEREESWERQSAPQALTLSRLLMDQLYIAWDTLWTVLLSLFILLPLYSLFDRKPRKHKSLISSEN